MSDRDQLDLVTVLETADAFALTLAKSSLEDAGIDCLVSAGDARYSTQPGFYGVGAIPLGWKCLCKVQVARESEAEARALLEPLRDPMNIEAESDS